MRLGFIIKKISGKRCREIRICLQVFIGWILERKLGNVLAFVLLYIRREYIAPNTVVSVIIGVDIIFQSMIVDRIRSSPISFGVGGSPSLETQVISHQIVNRGVTSLNPRVIDRVRVFFRS